MTTKLEQAARRLKDLLVRPVDTIAEMYCYYIGDIDDALKDIREVLDHSGEATEMVQEPMFKVGNLVTVNSDPYPALGHLFVQLWDGDDLVARVYADDEQTLNKRVSALNASRSKNK